MQKEIHFKWGLLCRDKCFPIKELAKIYWVFVGSMDQESSQQLQMWFSEHFFAPKLAGLIVTPIVSATVEKNGPKKCLKNHIPFDFWDDSTLANQRAGKTIEKPLKELPWNQQYTYGSYFKLLERGERELPGNVYFWPPLVYSFLSYGYLFWDMSRHLRIVCTPHPTPPPPLNRKQATIIFGELASVLMLAEGNHYQTFGCHCSNSRRNSSYKFL